MPRTTFLEGLDAGLSVPDDPELEKLMVRKPAEETDWDGRSLLFRQTLFYDTDDLEHEVADPPEDSTVQEAALKELEALVRSYPGEFESLLHAEPTYEANMVLGYASTPYHEGLSTSGVRLLDDDEKDAVVESLDRMHEARAMLDPELYGI